MTTKHTPAPWWHCENETNYAIGHGNREIAWVGQTMRVSTIEAHKESKANARLIAAAPELLEALKEARDEIAFLQDKTGFKDKTKIKRYDRLIAKAEGRE